MAIKQTAGRDSLGEFAPKFVKAEKKESVCKCKLIQ